MRLQPLNIQHVGEEIAIAWNDSSESFIRLEALRRACPCAACGGEPDILGNIERPVVDYTHESFRLKAFLLVGGYALQPAWADGHATGLYSYPLLQRLALPS